MQQTIVIWLSFNWLMHCTLGGTEGGRLGGLEEMGGVSVWVMPSVDVYENFLKQSQAVSGGGHPHWILFYFFCFSFF